MDINAALDRMRKLAKENIDSDDYEPNGWADQFQTIDEWLSGKGFLPNAWQR